MSEPLRPARVDFSDAAAPRAPDYDDVYHPRGGAFAQARHVFLAGNGLPRRWSGRTHFVILETGFGLGHNFLATWSAWRDDPRRCEHLWFLSVDKHPLLAADMRRAHADSAEPSLARELVDTWPPLTADLHRRDFARGRVHLLLAFGDVANWLSQWVAAVDAFYLDGFAPARNPAMWQPPLLQRLGRLAADDATAATWSSARIVRDALDAAGFVVLRAPGFDAKRDMLCAHHAPGHRPQQPAGRRFGAAPAHHVAIVGAGLAGAATARALAALGIACTVFDAAPAVAHGGSGQPAALLHGVVHADDSPHTRWFRAAALRAHAAIAPLIAQQRARGRLDGVLRLERRLDLASMLAMLDAQGLPPEYAQALSVDQACRRAGCSLTTAAWLYPGGGWVEPLALVRTWLDDPLIEVRLNAAIDRIESDQQGRWHLLDAAGHALATDDHLVLANADGVARLVADEAWPLRKSRGQITLTSAPPDWRPALPVAGDGYAVALPHERLLCGATSDIDDATPDVRDRDHQRNLAALQRLSGRVWAPEPSALEGRVAWRVHTRDRLPLVGGVPLSSLQRAGATRQEQARFIARRPGLYVLAALGSRGLAQATLAADAVAAMIAGTPLPIGSSLLDAIDAARFAARAARVADQ